MQIKRLSIDKQLHLGWSFLYEIEVVEDMPLEDMLARLNATAECLATLRTRKRFTPKQQEKLTNLEKWFQSYDIKRLQKDIKNQNKAIKKKAHH